MFENLQIGPLTILFGKDNGKYPHGNSLFIRGANTSMLVDPCLGVVERDQAQVPVPDTILLSHVHEDHVAGVHLFPDASVLAHEADAPGMRDIAGLLDIYGFQGQLREEFTRTLTDEFFYVPRPDVQTFTGGQQFDLGGVWVEVLHTPGHTRGHCCFRITWEGEDRAFVYLGDIELTGFGPYYGDAWSDLEDFERSLATIRATDAHWWLTFHHKGLITGRDKLLPMLDAFEAVIGQREQRLLDYLAEPHTLDEIVAHRFIYRPGVASTFVENVERRSMSMHLQRLLATGRVSQSADYYQVS
ncbi:MAG: MBL fold metallo-hydrolase [Pseudomonadales bacterium]|nr:MBL fold metallo-hydrolase [Pseudomonadales bacterium]